uniref:Uncharacterized protein n=1 Tax=Lepeophtheirus salmonis TaxID=72036 RepID=A0A0K2T727_LEPSM
MFRVSISLATFAIFSYQSCNFLLCFFTDYD